MLQYEVLKHELNEKQAARLDTISTSAEHLRSVIDDILDLSKIEAGAMHPSPRPTHLGEVQIGRAHV